MISVCTVTLDPKSDYLRVFAHSVLSKLAEVREVIIVVADAECQQHELLAEWSERGVKFRVFRPRLIDPPGMSHMLGLDFSRRICGHALGLHYAIRQASQPYVLLSDPDVFFLSDASRAYSNLMEIHNLNVIGVSHFNADGQSYDKFPCVINMMVRKADLPGDDWLAGDLWLQNDVERYVRADGKFLLPGPPRGHEQKFPNPSGVFDVGCCLYLWNADRPWLAFTLDHAEDSFANNYGVDGLVYPMNYSFSRYATNFGLTGSFGCEDLLYHRTRGCKVDCKDYVKLYESVFGGTVPELPINS